MYKREEELLVELHSQVEKFNSSLPEKVAASDFKHNYKIPFKIVSLRETLYHRAAELLETGLDLCISGKLVAATLMARALLETLAIMFALDKNIEKFLEEKNISEFDEFLMNLIFGSKSQPEMRKATNSVTMIDKVDRTYKGTNEMYAIMSEISHPNCSGVHTAFGTLDKENKTLNTKASGETMPKIPKLIWLLSFSKLFELHYNSVGERMVAVNSYFENLKEV